VFFKRKNGWGSFSTQAFGTTKSSGSGNGFKLRQSSWSSGVFTIEVEKKAREGIPKLQCS